MTTYRHCVEDNYYNLGQLYVLCGWEQPRRGHGKRQCGNHYTRKRVYNTLSENRAFSTNCPLGCNHAILSGGHVAVAAP